MRMQWLIEIRAYKMFEIMAAFQGQQWNFKPADIKFKILLVLTL